ncbi:MULTISPECIES: carbon-nitrogen hydrolase family protein [unclassified Archaeoglobus]|jgi:amidase/nitrilase|uniref:carbon-nitrogen hydrolase family protein n=1 Tax=unclassified Archaeoglobus TaxID=2643606 RepID=UPI0025BF6508|nr:MULTISPECIES: carbon-nitrogen hydrolase family protein [unclassified Archaeoglobus]
MKVAIAQIEPDYMSKEGSIDRAVKAIEEAGKKGAKIIAFPETFIPGYPYWRGFTGQKWADYMLEYQRNSVRLPQDLSPIMEAAKEGNINVVLGVSELDDKPGSLTLYNTIAFVSSRGEYLGRHRKLMPTHGERMVWGLGDGRDIEAYKTDVGMIGGLVCYENHMTPIKSLLALKGEEIHIALWPGYWVAEKTTAVKRRFDPEKDRIHQCDVDCAIREYAFETQTFVLSANMYLSSDLLPEGAFDIAAGGSSVVNPSSLYIVEPVLNRAEIIYADIDVRERMVTKAYFDCVGHYSRWDVVEIKHKEFEKIEMEKRLEEIEERVGELEKIVAEKSQMK